MELIDTHTHFHDPDKTRDLLWPKPGDAYNRTCMPDNYRAEVGAGPVVAVETSPRRIDDLRLAEIAHGDDMVLCYVNNLQPLEDGFEDRLQIALVDPKWRGVRLRPIEAYDLTSNGLIRALSFMEDKGHVELGIRHAGRLAPFRNLCRNLPGVQFVLTHCGHPDLERDETGYDYDHLRGLDNVFFKLSAPQFSDFSAKDVRGRLKRHIHLLRELFSADRLMFGSNWPVCSEVDDFRDWLGDLFANRSGEAEAVFGQTAAKVYRVGRANGAA